MTKSKNWFTTPANLTRFSWFRVVSLVLGILAYFVTEYGRFFMRPYFRRTGISDFGLTDSIGNLGGIMVQIFLGSALMHPNRIQSYRLATFFAVGFILYEFLQLVLPRGTFDWNDVWATVVGWLLSVMLLWILWKWIPGPEKGIQNTGTDS